MPASGTLAYLYGLTNYEQVTPASAEAAFSLARMRRLLEALGRPERRWPAIHVAGTKGKGSTCAMLASVFRAAGRHVGLYTSPHLMDLRERIQLDGRWVPADAFAEAVAAVRAAADGLPEPPTFFEACTAAACWWFARQAVDLAVVEVGVGGRLDATNLVAPLVTVITPISRDHTALLGSTLEAIAAEKAGILKPGCPVVMAPQPAGAGGVIRRQAAACGAPLVDVAAQVRTRVLAVSLEGQQVQVTTPRGPWPVLTLPLLGAHQVQNLATAVAALEQLPPRWAVPPSAVVEGIAAVSWPGRVQILERAPWVIVDGAHNAASAAALRETVQALWPGCRVHLILGCSADKDVAGLAQALRPLAPRVTATAARHPRALPAPALAAALAPWFDEVTASATVAEAVALARAAAAPDDCIIVTGSFFVVGELLSEVSAIHG